MKTARLASIFCILFAVFVFAGIVGCLPLSRSAAKEPVVLRFSITVDESVCDAVKGQRRPQVAVWLEDTAGEEIRTVCVTGKTAKGNWGGETTRPVSLPYWVSRWNRETGTQGDPSPKQPALDAVTCATPQAELECRITAPRGTRWQYFVEVNQSFDNNEHFPQVDSEGRKDLHSNGQPSIVYTGRITAIPGRTGSAELLGRTEQFEPTTTLNKDLSGITSAAGVLKDITVSCEAQPGLE
ncbi:MAG: hypothetical protein IH624_06410 [Phycisphaerae bacterium]|nr:hypothetical protein [Phycisphaerae bacterium]